MTITANQIDIDYHTFGPNAKDFTPEEQKLIDIQSLQRGELTITFKKLTDDAYLFMRDVARNQYKLPIKYLKLVPGSFEYVCQKSALFGKDLSVKNASVTIEPLHNDYATHIQYTPINQSLPLHTMVELAIDVPYTGDDAKQQFIWSNNLSTIANIEKHIKQTFEEEHSEKVGYNKCMTLKPWVECCHYGSVDIGSMIRAKFEVDYVDVDMFSSYCLFGFRRDEDDKECRFSIWCYRCYNLTPFHVLELLKEHENTTEEAKKVIDIVLEKGKGVSV
jgi:hypothetical protein